MQDSLSSRIRQGKGLTPEEQLSLVRLLGNHCQERTKGYIAFSARIVPDVKNYGIYERVLFSENGHGTASYCAGQSYPDEIRTVRELLIGRKGR